MPDGAQPGAEGQGTEGQDAGGLYGSVLEGIPEQFHGTLTERLTAKDAELNKAHQQKVEGWKPYEDLGLRDVDPQVIGSYLDFGNTLAAAGQGDAQALQAIQEWWTGIGNELGFAQENGAEQQDGDASDLLDMSPDQLQQIVGQQVAEGLNPILERMEQQEQQQALAAAEQEVSDQVAALRKDNPELTDEDEKRILAFAYMFGQDSEDPINAGFEEFKQVAARGENELFRQKLAQPAPAEGAGRANTAAEAPTTFEDAKAAALDRMRQAVGT